MDNLRLIKSRFEKFRSSHPQQTGKKLRYPPELQKLIFDTRSAGASYRDLATASGLSDGGLFKMIDRLRKGASVAPASSAKKAATPAKVAATQTPNKQGRPLKAGSTTTPLSLAAPAPKKRGRPPKAATTPVPLSVVQPAPKKRGRPPKAIAAAAASRPLPATKAAARKVVAKKTASPKAPLKKMAVGNGAQVAKLEPQVKKAMPKKVAASHKTSKKAGPSLSAASGGKGDIGEIVLTIGNSASGDVYHVGLSAKDMFKIVKEMIIR